MACIWFICKGFIRVGIQVSGNYNTIDMCTVNHAANSGIQISRNGGADNYAEFRVSYGQQEILSRTVSHLITVMRKK